VWRFVSSLLKDPDRVRANIETLIEREREAVGLAVPEREARLRERIAELLNSRASTKTSRRPSSRRSRS
jgi:hypothetical protein